MLDVDWKMFRHKNDDTFGNAVTKGCTITESQTYNLLLISLFRRCEKPRKLFK